VNRDSPTAAPTRRYHCIVFDSRFNCWPELSRWILADPDREDASSMVTADATANTTVKNSRASRESGLLCSHSHGESIDPQSSDCAQSWRVPTFFIRVNLYIYIYIFIEREKEREREREGGGGGGGGGAHLLSSRVTVGYGDVQF